MFLVLVSKCQHAAFLNSVYHGEPVMLHLLNISMLSCYHADVSIWINAPLLLCTALQRCWTVSSLKSGLNSPLLLSSESDTYITFLNNIYESLCLWLLCKMNVLVMF